jgi:glutamate dehydrogenase/leucine dehydrogenase
MGPVDAPRGTRVRMNSLVSRTNTVAVLPNFTAVTWLKFTPWIKTGVSTVPLGGAKARIRGRVSGTTV